MPNTLKSSTPLQQQSPFSLPQPSLPSARSSSTSTPEVKRTKMATQNHGSFLTSTIIKDETEKESESVVEDPFPEGL